jgi:hypothetical protein
MVVAVPQNIVWNMKNDVMYAEESIEGKKEFVPIMPEYSAPNIRPYPTAQKLKAEKTKSARFLAATLIEFFDLVSPDSRHMKPGCIKNTSAAQIKIHNTSTSGFSIVRSLD